MQLRLFLLLILFFVCTSFFWDDEEKQVRQMHQNGEMALQKRDFKEAKEVFETLLTRISTSGKQKRLVDWNTYVDICLRLATCCEELNEKEEGIAVLKKLLERRPPEEFIPKITVMKIRLSLNEDSTAEGYLKLKELAQKHPVEFWPMKERSFFHMLEGGLNERYDQALGKAKRFLLAGLYEEASHLYEEALNAVLGGYYPKIKSEESLPAKKIRYRLAESCFLATDYAKSLRFCQNEKITDTLDREMLYLSALCYREKKEYEKAIDYFQDYTHLAARDDLEHYDHALFEIGYYYYQNGFASKAKAYFERVRPSQKKPSLLAALYLARIDLESEKPQEAEKLLSLMLERVPSKDPLRYEFFYLRGMAAYAVGEFGEAIDFFERSLPDKKSSWRNNSLYHLGWCYLQLGNNLVLKHQIRLYFFTKAEVQFKQLLGSAVHEAACLSLGQLYVYQYRHFAQEESLKQLEEILQSNKASFSLEGEARALLLCAESIHNFDEKETIYLEATQEKYSQTPAYAQCWYCLGLNYFQEGLQDPDRNTHLFDKAALAFEKAFRVVEKNDKDQAASLLKLEAKANMYRNSPLTSLGLLEKLLSQFEETVEEREETLYLKGLLASRLSDLSYFTVAEETLNQVISHYPNGKYKDASLFALGNLYMECEDFGLAKQMFIRLGEEHPFSSYAPEAWFRAAESARYLGEDTAPYCAKVYKLYPESELAPEAYFRQYPYSFYVEGCTEALSHLKKFTEKFSQSPFLIPVSFLIGINEADTHLARKSFQAGLEAFSNYTQTSREPLDSTLVFFRYETMLKLASLLLSSAENAQDLQECETLLNTLVDEFAQKEHPYASLLRKNTPYHPFFEEGAYKLVQCYLKEGKEFSAQKLLSQMLAHYTAAGIQEGFFLSQVWQEQGKLAMHCQDFETALHCFELAHECGSPYFSEEQKLVLWLLQSDCFKAKKEYATAMRFLSKVINSETSSPLRLKAMYLRAELYELEGRPELAYRQLEAAAKKGGGVGKQSTRKVKSKLWS